MSTLSALCFSGLMLSAAQTAIAQVPTIPVAQIPSSSQQYNVLFVNSSSGNDSGNGSEQAPLKTITQALRVVQPGTLILLAPGTYSAQTGETFPLYLKPGTTIKGEPRDRGQSVIIQGGGFFLSRTFARQNVAIVGANQAGLTGVTVTNANPQGYGLWVESTSPVISDNTFTGSDHDGASVVGSSAPILRNNYFYQNGANGITIYGTSRPELLENIFEKTGFGINIAQNAAPRLTGNRVTQNKDGIVIQGKARPTLRGNVVDSNSRDGMVAIAQSRPNLGTSADPGNNTFMGNGQLDINAKTSSETIAAFGNQLASNKTNGKLDYSGTVNVADIPVAPTNVASSVPFRQEVRQSPKVSALPPPTNPIVSIPVPAPASVPRLASPPEEVRQSPKVSALPPPTNPIVSIPVPAPASVPRLASPPEAPKTPIFSRPAATSLRRLPAPKETVPQVSVAPPTSPAPLLAKPALFSRPAASGAIAIPVPAPESGTLPSSTINPPSTVAAASSQGILPVPSADAPLGNVGSTSSVPIWRNPTQRSEGSPPIPPTRAVAMALRYRVVVEVDSDSQQSQVRAIVPDAFPVSLRGRTLMQAGAFGDRTKADELLQSLLNQGLKAAIEQL
jgi:parallel beta-helix repeat protein